ncbi:MAG: glycine cleavage system aminomethyltransferase GcvT [bacterium]|nr:glycine cleavage system aminomethyltransferase GcvT [bacterium]
MSSVAAAARTALYDRHIALGARMASFAGFEMPMWYAGIKVEHCAVRTSAGLFDLSHMGEVYIEGPHAYEFVQHLTCNDIRRVGDGGCQYTLFPTPEGGVVDDLIAYQWTPERYMLVVNASNIEKDVEWINSHNKFDAKVTDHSAAMSLVAVQGPKTDAILTDFGVKNIACQPQFTFRKVKVQGNEVIVAGTGYTGERGFELIVENDKAPWLWDRLMEVGAPHGIAPVGLGARDTLRLEMAYSLYGHELSSEISVLNANLGWTVRLGNDFIGRDFLAAQKQKGVDRIIAGFVVDAKLGAPRQGAPVFNDNGGEIGYVTSGSFSPSLEKGIALCLIDPKFAQAGGKVQVDIRGGKVPGDVVDLPFYKKPNVINL